MFGYFMQAEMSAPMLARHPALLDWWQSMQARASFLATRPAG